MMKQTSETTLERHPQELANYETWLKYNIQEIMFRCTIHLTCETSWYCLKCSSNWLTIIRLFTIYFLFGNIIVLLVHQSIMKSFTSCGKTSEWLARLGLIQKAFWIVSKWTCSIHCHELMYKIWKPLSDKKDVFSLLILDLCLHIIRFT
jgi:hypothetical protein